MVADDLVNFIDVAVDKNRIRNIVLRVDWK